MENSYVIFEELNVFYSDNICYILYISSMRSLIL